MRGGFYLLLSIPLCAACATATPPTRELTPFELEEAKARAVGRSRSEPKMVALVYDPGPAPVWARVPGAFVDGGIVYGVGIASVDGPITLAMDGARLRAISAIGQWLESYVSETKKTHRYDGEKLGHVHRKLSLSGITHTNIPTVARWYDPKRQQFAVLVEFDPRVTTIRGLFEGRSRPLLAIFKNQADIVESMDAFARFMRGECADIKEGPQTK